MCEWKKVRPEMTQDMTQLEQGALEATIYWRRLKGSGEMMQRVPVCKDEIRGA